MTLRVLRPADYQRVPWKNGGGMTAQLAVHPTDRADDFDWRISIAEIESNGPFSLFPGCDRAIALLDGVGMELRFDEDAEPVRLERRLHFARFRGEWHTRGVLLAGKVRDFNIIWKRDAVNAEVLHRPLVGPMVFFRDTTWFIYLADGHAQAKCGDEQHTLDAGASLLLEAATGAQRVVLNGGGDVVLVKFSAVATDQPAR